MKIEISFPSGVAVEARFGGHAVRTDQPPGDGGAGSAPTPFELFLASLGTCSGFYALRFCQQRGIATEGLGVTLETERNAETRRLDRIAVALALPPGFPEKYREAILRAVDQCAVKKAILDPPEMPVTITG